MREWRSRLPSQEVTSTFKPRNDVRQTPHTLSASLRHISKPRHAPREYSEQTPPKGPFKSSPGLRYRLRAFVRGAASLATALPLFTGKSESARRLTWSLVSVAAALAPRLFRDFLDANQREQRE